MYELYKACADANFSSKGLDEPGTCGIRFNTVDSTEVVLQCPDGVTNVKYCAATALNVTFSTKGQAGVCLYNEVFCFLSNGILTIFCSFSFPGLSPHPPTMFLIIRFPGLSPYDPNDALPGSFTVITIIKKHSFIIESPYLKAFYIIAIEQPHHPPIESPLPTLLPGCY